MPASQSKPIAERFAAALRHFQAGELTSAEALVRQILAAEPGHVDSWRLRGLILCGAGNRQEALGAYEKALSLNPSYLEAHGEMGLLFMELDRADDAAACFRRVLALNPKVAAGHNGLGTALARQGRLDEAISAFRKAVEMAPGLAEAHHNLGDSYQARGRLAEAVASYERVLAILPDLAEAHNNLAAVLQKQGKHLAAAKHFERAVSLKPDFAEAQMNLAGALSRGGETARALEHCERALSLRPDYPAAMFARCAMQLPILYRDEAEIASRRIAYQQQLAALCDQARGSTSIPLVEGVGTHQPFRLPYQGLNDRDLQTAYGSLVCRIMGDAFAPVPMPKPPAAGERVRVGIVSGYFRDHSNWKMPIKGWLTQLDRTRFELFGYHTGSREDGETAVAKSFCRRFVRGPLSDAQWRQEILSDAPHVLIYPEVGMDPVSVRLAAQRLAPVQCNSWGHPVTSGFPTLDYFLSSDLMEPADGEAHYTERLVRLPNLSIYCEPLATAPVAMSRRDLGIGTGTIYWCGQSLFKYLPQFDHVLARIARDAGDSQFVFIEYPNGAAVTEQFRQRLQQSFAAQGLSAEKSCVILPRLDAAKFAAAAGLCDVVLDSIGWSGCNSTMEVLAHDLPVVTIGSTFMRGRHSMAILKMMGISETIASNLDEYVSIAVRLARDPAWRSMVRARIRDNKHRVLRDRACIGGLEDFLDAAARNAAF